MSGALIVFALVAVALLGYVYMNRGVTTGASGGVTVPANSANTPLPPVVVSTPTGTAVVPAASQPTVPYTAAVVAPPPAVVPMLVKFIKLQKDMTAETVPDYRTLQVAEVKAYDANGVELSRSAYSDVSYATGLGKQAAGQANYPASYIVDGDLNTFTETIGTETGASMPIHSLTLTLANPTNLSKIAIYNRTSYMPQRLNGTTVSLISDTGAVLWTSAPLSASTDVQILNPQYSSGFLSGFISKSPSSLVKKMIGH